MKTNADSSPGLRVSRGGTSGAIGLSRRQVIRIERRDGVRRVQVRQGVVWLTGSPGREDILVRHGEEYRLPAEWPFVLEALSDARVELLA